MKSIILTLAFILLINLSLPAQTLFSYADKSVSSTEYVKAFNKVYPAPVTEKAKKMREYLDLYINSKLKIHEAMARGYDTLPAFIEEFSALRNQVVENYMTDNETIQQLVNEAFDRSQKDINVQHIFIPYVTSTNYSDSLMIKLKMQEAYMQLQSGKSFNEVALKYSTDPAVGENKGHIGFITAFSLPYEFENIIYGLKPGKYSSPYRSGFGYHIFKNLGERKAVGKIKAAQILLVIPPGSDSAMKTKLGALADSLYNRLQKGDDFAKLARSFSNDVVSSASGGQMQEFGPGTYNALFENVVFSLPADGAISKPFMTSYGYHIVKRLSITAPPSVKNKKNLDERRVKVESDNRADIAREKLYQNILQKSGLKETEVNKKELQSFLDSLLAAKTPSSKLSVNKGTVLLVVGNVYKNAGDFFTYSINNRFYPEGNGVKTFEKLYDDFKRATIMEYYRDHLEDFNDEFKGQMKELKDGNLFFDIMMREVWSKAQSDTLGQHEYFNANKSKYNWKYSADAVIFYCSDDVTANAFRKEVEKDPKNWKQSLENYSDKISADSARFEVGKITGAQKASLKNGLITPVIKNNDDNSASFAYIIKIYPNPAPKSFADARADVIADYQDAIDKKWIADLKNKFPVKVNEEVLKTISR